MLLAFCQRSVLFVHVVCFMIVCLTDIYSSKMLFRLGEVVTQLARSRLVIMSMKV